MQSIKNFSGVFFTLFVVSIFMFSIAIPAGAVPLPPSQDVPAGGQGSSSGGSISSCESISHTGFSGVVSCITGFINTAIGLIIAAAVLYIVWGAFTMIRSEEKREEGKKIIMYGIIGLFVMISIWGFVNILDRTFGLSLDASSVTIPKLIR